MLKTVLVNTIKQEIRGSVSHGWGVVPVIEQIRYSKCEQVYVKDGALVIHYKNNKNKTIEVGYSLTHIEKWIVEDD